MGFFCIHAINSQFEDKLRMKIHAYNLSQKGDATEGPKVSVQDKILRDISWGWDVWTTENNRIR